MAFDLTTIVKRQEQSNMARVAPSLLGLMRGGTHFSVCLAPAAFGMSSPALKHTVDQIMQRIQLAPFASVVEENGKIAITIADANLSAASTQACIARELAAACSEAAHLSL